MKRFLILTALEIKQSLKKAIKIIPSALLMFLVVLALFRIAGGLLENGAGVLTGSNKSNSSYNSDNSDDSEGTGATDGRMRLALVDEDGSKMMELAKTTLTTTQSVTEIVEIVFMDRDEAKKALENREVLAAVVVSAGTLKSIMNGENIPIEVWFQENAGFEAALIKEAADAAVSYLKAAQAGIYSVYDFYANHLRSVYRNEAVERLNLRYIKTVLLRDGFFEKRETLVTGEVTPAQYYLFSGIVLYLMLFGINALTYGKKNKRELFAMLANSGTDGLLQEIAALVGIYFMYLPTAVLLFTVSAILLKIPAAAAFRTAAAVLLIILPVSAIVLFVREFVENVISAAALIFMLAAAQSFVCGGLIPEILLPGAVSALGKFTPAYYMTKIVKNAYMGTGESTFAAAVLIFITVISVLLSAGRRRIR